MYALKEWKHPTTGEIRLYVNGTTRQGLWLSESKTDKSTLWSSKTNETPHRFQTGDHYGKIRKDRDAATTVAEAFGIQLGEPPFSVALQIARDGIEIGG